MLKQMWSKESPINPKDYIFKASSSNQHGFSS